MKRVNVVLVDAQVNQEWEFVKGLREETRTEWEIRGWDNAGLRKNIWSTIQRLAGYFVHAFEIFSERKRYATIVAWQQFYGLLFAFYCNLFKVKKTNRLIVMTFIYREKRGIAGAIYKRLITSIVRSDYVDKFVVFSEAETTYYAELFSVPRERFEHLLLGIQAKRKTEEAGSQAGDLFLLSVGRSNRDYEFLFACADDIPYPIVVLTDSLPQDVKLPANVTLRNNVRGKAYLNILSKCHAVLIPLKSADVSSGQMVMLQAMQYEKPILVTESNTISDYVTDGYNAIVCKKDCREFSAAVRRIVNDRELYRKLTRNGLKMFNEKFSLIGLGRKVAHLGGETDEI